MRRIGVTKTEVVRVSDSTGRLGDELDRWGYAVTPLLLDDEQCRELSDLFDLDEDFRSTIVMSRGSSSTTPSDAVGGVYEVA